MPLQSDSKIVLVAPGPHRMQLGGALLHLPLAVLSLAGWLRRDRTYAERINIVDMYVRKPSIADFENTAIVGISAMTGHQVHYGLKTALLARQANPDALIVWGGVHPTLMPEQTIRHELVDVVVISEGEETFQEVVDAVFSGNEIAHIPGTCVWDRQGNALFGPRRSFIDLNTLPLPAYDLVDISDYQGIEHQFDYQSSRGCPFGCGFCYNTVFCGRKWRAKSAEKVVNELAYLHDKYNVKKFAMVDDEFFIDIARAEAIGKGIIEKGMEFGIVASCRLDIVRKFSQSALSILKKAGIIQLFLGAESGSNEILRHIHKNITTDDTISGALKVAESGIRPILSFMSGFPDETFAQFEKTLDIIQTLWDAHPLITVNGIFPFNAYPGTELYLKSRELGLSAPQTLDEWGNWNFQYEPDNPWLNKKMKQWMQTAFYIVRFRYYLARFEDRHGKDFRVYLLKLLLLPLSISAEIRWRKRWFGFALEWRIFALMAEKTFGYL